MISIPMRYIRAAMAILDMKDRREYCRGVWVEFNGKESRIVATSGTILLVVRWQCDKTLDSGTFLAGEELKRVHENAENIHLAKDGTWSSDTVGGVSITGKAYPGVRYPEWRSVIPVLPMVECPVQYDPKLLMRLEKAGGPFNIFQRGPGCGLVTWDDPYMFAIINPRNGDMLPVASHMPPDWAHR